jgi:hypothetical protein
MNLQETNQIRKKMEHLRRDIKTSNFLNQPDIEILDKAYGLVDLFIHSRNRAMSSRWQWHKVDITGCINIGGRLVDIGLEHAGNTVCLQSNNKIFISGVGEIPMPGTGEN